MDDETNALENPATAECTATGIERCLRMLADEAAALQLCRTLAALRTAIDICAVEGGSAAAALMPPPGARLH